MRILDENNKWITQVNYALALEAVAPFSPRQEPFMKAIRKKQVRRAAKAGAGPGGQQLLSVYLMTSNSESLRFNSDDDIRTGNLT